MEKTRCPTIFLLCAVMSAAAFAADTWKGTGAGIEGFELPDMPDGTHPYQNWWCMGNGPDGTILIGGMDHSVNSALYQFNPSTSTVRLLGDAKTAAREAGILKSGETFEKFHDRPVMIDGKAYVASTDNSTLTNNDYLACESFHWFCYDFAAGKFTDLSANDPGRSSIQRHQMGGGLAVDSARKCIYGTTMQKGILFKYDVSTHTTSNLGRHPSISTEFVSASTFVWTDSQGRVYVTYAGGSSAECQKVYYWDPSSGWQATTWVIDKGSATDIVFGRTRISHGGWTQDRKYCYCVNYEGHVYRFADAGPSWEYVGRLNFGPGASGDFATHVLAISPDNKKLYTVNSHKSGSPKYYIIEFDLTTKANRNILCLNDVDPRMTWTQIMYHCGDQIWDNHNYLYFSNFDWKSGNVRVTRFNPWLYEGTDQPVAVAQCPFGLTRSITKSRPSASVVGLAGTTRIESVAPAALINGRTVIRQATSGRAPAATVVRSEQKQP